MTTLPEQLRALYATHPICQEAADRIEWLERQVRVDLAIARQLGEAISENAKLRSRVAELERR